MFFMTCRKNTGQQYHNSAAERGHVDHRRAVESASSSDGLIPFPKTERIESPAVMAKFRWNKESMPSWPDCSPGGPGSFIDTRAALPSTDNGDSGGCKSPPKGGVFVVYLLASRLLGLFSRGTYLWKFVVRILYPLSLFFFFWCAVPWGM